jgi:hypothetical protein
LEFAGFRLDINKYQPIAPNAQGWLWSETLGFFLGIHERQLRYFSLEGILLPTPQEAAKNEILKANQARLIAQQAQQVAEQERQVAEQERQIAQQAKTELRELQEKMRSLGISCE